MPRLQNPVKTPAASVPSPRPVPVIPPTVMLDEQSPRLDVHSNVKLFPHQQAIVSKLIEMETQPRSETFVGVLNDPPGSGKSFPLLALMLHEKRVFGKTQNLLVIPHNIHSQWLEYIAKFSNELSAFSLMYYDDINKLGWDPRPLEQNDILITTSSFYSMVTETLLSKKLEVNRVIMDEIDSISFFTNTMMPSRSIWLVSASAEMTKKGIYKQYTKKNGIVCDPLFIRRSINLPGPVLEHHTCYNEFVQVLQQDVIPDMSPVYAVDFTGFKFEYLRNENISNPKELLSAVFRDSCLALHSTVDSMGTLEEGAKYQTYLVDSHSKKVDKREKLRKSINSIISLTVRRKCPMCCDNFAEKNSRFSTKCCETLFCGMCIRKWLSQTPKCPQCCISLKEEDLVPDSKDIAPIPAKPAQKDKMEEFEDILKKEIARENFRILIFSDYTGTFLKVQEILKKYDLKHAEIEGNQYSINKAIEDYQTGVRPILLVDSQAYGAGMNMEMTTGVIIMHKTEREKQIIGRAQRLGRTATLHVHHLIYNAE